MLLDGLLRIPSPLPKIYKLKRQNYTRIQQSGSVPLYMSSFLEYSPPKYPVPHELGPRTSKHIPSKLIVNPGFGPRNYNIACILRWKWRNTWKFVAFLD